MRRLMAGACAIGGIFLPLVTFSVDTSASTGVFGYDRVSLPKAGEVLRTDVFVTAGGKATDRSFHLDDLGVLGYDRTKGSAGAFWFYVVGFDAAGTPGVAREKSGAKRELSFYWYDVPTGDRARAPGWYDADGTNRWENLAFGSGEVFCIQGGGLTLETNGLVFDTYATNILAGVSSAVAANTRPMRQALAGVRVVSEGGGHVYDDVTLRTLANGLTTSNEYVWDAYRSGWETGLDASFDMGEAFLVVPCEAGAAASSAPAYRWKATVGGIPAPDAETNLVATAVYLFDARTLSPSNLVANLRKGAALSEQAYVIGKALTDGVLPTTDDFAYAAEPVGTAWGAYMALEYTVGGRRYAYLTEAVDVMGVAFGRTEIAFGASGASAPSVSPADETYAAPGWYALTSSMLLGALSPSKGESAREVTAADATAAASLVQIVSPDEATVSSADYAKYFKLVATPLSEGTYLVRAELDAEAIELDKTTSDLAGSLSGFAAAGGTTVTIEVESKAGLSYRVLSASSVAGPYEKGDATQATGEKTAVGVKVPEGGSGFFKVEADVK